MTRKRNVITSGPKRRKAVFELSHRNAEAAVITMEKEKNLIQLQNCCGLRHFMHKLRYWKIDDHRWGLLRRTPFGSLIKDIVELNMNVEVVDALLGFWDEENCGFSIGGVIIPFSVDDIALITGLPNRGLEVVMNKRSSSKSDVKTAVLSRDYSDMWMTEWRLETLLANKNDLNPEDDKLFVQLMILYLWGYVMFALPSRSVPLYMFPYVENLDAIESFNWAEALHSFLAKEICLKAKLLMKPNREQKHSTAYIYSLSYVINVWCFEHVNFGEDSRPSNPHALPRMLKWVGCKFWEKKAFILRLNEIGEDKVTLHLVPKNEEFKLVACPNVEHMPSKSSGSCDAEMENPPLLGNCDGVQPGFECVYAGMVDCNRVAENVKKEAEEEKKASEVEFLIELGGMELSKRVAENDKKKVDEEKEASEVQKLKEIVDNLTHEVQSIQREKSQLEKRVENLETINKLKGWEIEHRPYCMDDLSEYEDCEVGAEVNGAITQGEVDELSPNGLLRTLQGRHGLGKKKVLVGIETCDQICQPKNSRMARGIKQRLPQHVNGKRLRSSVVKEQFMVRDRTEIFNEQLSVPGIKTSKLFEKDSDMLVNLDDYPCPIEQEAKAAPLNYVGRELVTEDERCYLDAFCKRPMQRDDIVFYHWNIVIRRQSMLDYLQGGCTREEIIDAYARILSERAMFEIDKFASFFYVPPIFLGLYRNKLKSYKTFLNAINNSLKKVKFLFLPCHIPNSDHWLLLVCDIEMHKWIVYDSLYDPRHREAVKEQRKLFAEFLYEDHGFDSRCWSLDYRRDAQQEPGTLDCGVFVMKFMETTISIPREINFRYADMRLFRAQIAHEILCHS